MESSAHQPNLIPTTPQWAKRVAPWKIARLYEDDARGMHDETLLNEVAFALFSRCKSMLMVEEARLGRATCPSCESIILHPVQKSHILTCEKCGWASPWEQYRHSFRGKHLIAPGLQHFCPEYVTRLPAAHTARERMYWIDWLIHRVHWEGTALPGQPGATCLIQGRAQEVHAFLERLSFGTQRISEPGDLQQFWSAAELKKLEKWRRAADKRQANKARKS